MDKMIAIIERYCLALGAALVIGASSAAAGTASYRSVVLADNPIVYYELDELSGTTAVNSATTGATYDGSFNTAGGPVTVNQTSFAQGGTCYDFGGGFVGAASALTNSLDEWTVEAWVNYDAAKTSASNFLSNDQGGWNDDVLFGIGAEGGSMGVPAGSVGLIQQGSPGSTRDFVGSPLTAGQWHHAVVTGSTAAGAITLYVDGVVVGSDTSLVNGVTFNGADGIGTANLTLGASRPDGLRPYDGLLDEVAIYDHVLDAATVAIHYDAGSSTAGTPPVIATLSPADDTSGVALSSNLVATFSEPVVLTDDGTVVIRNLTLGSGSDVMIPLPDAGVSVSGKVLTIDPATDLALNTNYAIRISVDAVEDISGDAFVGILDDLDWNFMTVVTADVTEPMIVSTLPQDNAGVVEPSSNLVATFDEPVTLTGAGSVTIRNLTLGSGSDRVIPLPDARVSASGADLTINPAADFDFSTGYAVRISNDAVEDLAGNPFAGIVDDVVWNFTTAAGTPEPEDFDLEVTEYAPGSDPATFRWPTHIAFGPNGQEIISDLKNNRFMYRDGPDDAFQVSPVSVSGQHSVAYNPADGLYYADDTANHRMIAFSDLASGTIAAQTNSIAGVALNRVHDVVIDHDTGWIYALNPNSGHVFRFTAIGENESAIVAPVAGYARALTWANGKLYVIGSAKGRIVEVVDWDNETFNIYDSFDPSGSGGSAGTWASTGLVINDAEYFDGFWYATSYFSPAFGGGNDFDENKFIRFETLDDLVTGNWTDLSDLVPSGMTPYFLTVNGGSLYLAIFNHGSPGNGDSILQFSPVQTAFSIISAEHDSIADTISLTWESNEGEVFDVQKSLDLDSWMAVAFDIPAAAAQTMTTAIVDTNAVESRAFYRVVRLAGEE